MKHLHRWASVEWNWEKWTKVMHTHTVNSSAENEDMHWNKGEWTYFSAICWLCSRFVISHWQHSLWVWVKHQQKQKNKTKQNMDGRADCPRFTLVAITKSIIYCLFLLAKCATFYFSTHLPIFQLNIVTELLACNDFQSKCATVFLFFFLKRL